MLIQTTERAHARRCAELGGYWPHNALDLWWRCARRAPDRELLALRMLEQWRAHATFRLSSRLVVGDMIGFLDHTGAVGKAKCLDRLSVSALAACSIYRRLRRNYTGDAFAIGAAPTGIPLLGDTIDTSVIFTAGGTQSVNTVYDQSGSGFGNYSQVSGTNRPRVLNSGTLDVTATGVPTMVFASASNQALNGPTTTAYGLSGGPNLYVSVVAQWTTTGNYIFGLGRGSNYNAFRFGMGSAFAPIIDINGSGTARTTFTGLIDATSRHCAYAAAMGAGAPASAAACAQDYAALTPSAFGGAASNVINLMSTTTRWGCISDSVGAAAGWFNGRSNCMFLFTAALTLADGVTLTQEMARHV